MCLYVAEFYKTKCKEKEEEIVKWRKKAKELEEHATTRESRISQLEKRLKRLEYKHLEELKQKSETLQRVQAELLSKSEEITQMQMTARTYDSDYASRDARRLSLSSGGSNRSSLDSSARPNPGPPLEMPMPKPMRSRKSSESSTGSVEFPFKAYGREPVPPPPSSAHHHTRRSFNQVINRPASGRKLEPEEIDATSVATAEILEITKSQKERFSGQAQQQQSSSSKLLPPIPPSAPKAPRLQKTNSASFSRRKQPAESPSHEVETLAIDQVNGKTKKINLRQAHEFNSQD